MVYDLHHFLLRKFLYYIREKKMKGLIKLLAGTIAALACVAAFDADVYAATGIYVGKDVSVEGTTLLGTSMECQFGMSVVPEVMAKGSLRKGDVIESQNGHKYTMPEDSAKLILLRTMTNVGFGEWSELASNEYGVSVLANITTSANADAVKADPFVSDGVSEEKISLILASTSRTAREAVKTLCTLYDEKGAEAAELVLVADKEGAWVVENFTGHQYVAVRLPDDCMATFANEPIIRTADPSDKDTICSSKLFTLPEENGFAVYDKDKNIDLILTYNEDNSYSDESHIRGWVGHDLFAPSEELDYDVDEGYDVFFTPDEKVSIKQAFEFYRNRFEGTAYDLSDYENDYYWGINNQAVGNADIIQIFNDVPDELSSVIWATPANPTASPFIPIPAYADTIPASFSTDVTEEELVDGLIQCDFVKLNNNVTPRRNLYGASIRQYWQGMEAISANDIASSVRGKWYDEYKDSPAKAISEVNGYVDKVVGAAQEDCNRLCDELEWYFFKNGMRKESVPDDELQPFECSFDAEPYAHANGWETVIEGDVFTATKDGKTIEIVFDGENKGNVTFTGFDPAKLAEDFKTEDAEDSDENENASEEEDKSASKEADTPKELKEEQKDEPKEAAKEETKSEPADIDKITQEAAEKIEVDTIADLESYFAEKIADIPRDGWAENQIAKELNDVSTGVSRIISKHFGGGIEDYLYKDYDKLGQDIVNDPDVTKVSDKIVAAGMDLSALSERYFASLYDDVSSDVVSGRLSQEGAEKILSEAEADIEGIARLYLEGIEGMFDDVFNTELSEDEWKEIVGELGEGAVQVMDDYGLIDLDEMGLGDIDVSDLSDADVEVIITLNEMDDEVISGLSDMLGVDVASTLKTYTDALNLTGGNAQSPETDSKAKKNTKDDELAAVLELEEMLRSEDIEIPQEVIDILQEAIDEAAAERESEPAPSFEGQTYSINIGNVSRSGSKLLLPAFMLKYFD